MAFDFPGPGGLTVGQTVPGPGGQLYQWNGTGWYIAPASVAFASLASPAFTGNPTGPTAAPGDADTSLATTAFVANAVAGLAPLAAPVFTGDARAVTPAAGDADTSIATTAFVQAAVAPALNNVGRNLLHNPYFNVQQRGAGPWTAAGYSADRWYFNLGTDTVSFSVTALTDAQRAAIGDEAARYCFQNVFTGNAAAGAFNEIRQAIESVRRLSNKTVTVSFFAAASTAGLKLGIGMQQSFGSGGSPSSSVDLAGQAVTLTTTFTRYSMTFSLPSVAGKSLGTNGDDVTVLRFGYSSGSTYGVVWGNPGVQSGTVQIWGVQLEIGNTATALEKIDPGEDLRRCQRFYQVVNLIGAFYQLAGGAAQVASLLPVVMRATPAVVLLNNANANVSGLTVGCNGISTYTSGATATATGSLFISQNAALSADL